jgi:hypothetical protein
MLVVYCSISLSVRKPCACHSSILYSLRPEEYSSSTITICMALIYFYFFEHKHQVSKAGKCEMRGDYPVIAGSKADRA